MKFLEDTELVNLSTPHIRRLFVILDRGRVLWPIVAVTAALSGIVAVHSWEISDSAARWGLDSLRIIHSDPMQISLAAGPRDDFQPDSFQPDSFQPPLAHRLNAISFWMLSPMTHLGLLLPCCLAYVGLVGAVFMLYGQWCGPRYGFLAGMLVACHGPILLQATDPSPVSLCLCLAVLSIWLLCAHVQNPTRVISGRLALAGLCWGLCLLAGGWFVCVPMLTALVGLGWQTFRSPVASTASSARHTGFVAYLIAVAIAAAVVLGISLVPASGVAALTDVWSFLAGDNNQVAALGLPAVARQILADTGKSILGLSGLVIVGLGCMLRSTMIPLTSAGRGGIAWLVSWLGVSLACWCYVVFTHGPATLLAEMCRLNCVIGLIGCAVVCFEEAALCRIHPLILAVGVLFSGGVLFWTGNVSPSPSATNEKNGVILLLIVSVVLSVVVLATANRVQQRQRRRLVVSILLLVQIGANMSVGLSLAVNRNPFVPTLRGQLGEMAMADQGIFISEHPPPDRLNFALRTLVTDRRIKHFTSWNPAAEELEQVLERNSAASTILIAGWGMGDGLPLDSSRFTFEELRQSAPEQVDGRTLWVAMVNTRNLDQPAE